MNNVIYLNESTRLRMRIKRATRGFKGLAKCVPNPGEVGLRRLIRADADQAIEELERNNELPAHLVRRVDRVAQLLEVFRPDRAFAGLRARPQRWIVLVYALLAGQYIGLQRGD